MSVSLPPKVRVQPGDVSPQRRREIVLEYTAAPHGSKGKVAQRYGLNAGVIVRWRSALADGDLDRGKFPRKTGSMTRDDVAEIRRLEKLLADTHHDHERERAQWQQQITDTRTQLEAEQRARQKEAAEFQQRDTSWRKAVEGLGKAIEIMQTSTALDEEGKP